MRPLEFERTTVGGSVAVWVLGKVLQELQY
jgi:hypothetical protein